MPDKQQPMAIKTIAYTVCINPILPFILKGPSLIIATSIA
jgi:hypothetical protein